MYEESDLLFGETWEENSSIEFEEIYEKSHIPYTNGITFEQLMEHIYLKDKQLLQKIPIVGNDAPKKDILDLQERLTQKIKNGTIEKDFVLTPLLTLSPEQHWVVAVVSPDCIELFDLTLQTREQQYKISRFNVSQYDCINKSAIQRIDGTICGICSAEFMIEALKKNNLQELKRDIDDVCLEVAKNVYRHIGTSKAEKQFTDECLKNTESSITKENIQNKINKQREKERKIIQNIQDTKKQSEKTADIKQIKHIDF